MALQILLEGLDYEVMEAGDGEEAFGLARAFVPDVILLDVMMPKVDGFNALKSLKTDTITKNIPVIMVTARGGRNDEEIARGLGAFDYLHKPWSDGEVEMVVNWALTRQRRAA
jgi:two-component system chemotaxis response regulator CheY